MQRAERPSVDVRREKRKRGEKEERAEARGGDNTRLRESAQAYLTQTESTYAQLAGAVGLSSQTLSNWLAGRSGARRVE